VDFAADVPRVFRHGAAGSATGAGRMPVRNQSCFNQSPHGGGFVSLALQTVFIRSWENGIVHFPHISPGILGFMEH
jgi:hypothetical protein